MAAADVSDTRGRRLLHEAHTAEKILSSASKNNRPTDQVWVAAAQDVTMWHEEASRIHARVRAQVVHEGLRGFADWVAEQTKPDNLLHGFV